MDTDEDWRTVVTAGTTERNVAPPPMTAPPKKPMAKIVLVFINMLPPPERRHFPAAFMVFGSPSKFREPFVLATPPKLTAINPSGSLLMWNETPSLP